MKNARHPNFILGLISFILLFLGIGFQANGYSGGWYIVGAGILLGAIHWIWAITDVFKDFKASSKNEKRIIWIILVIIIPPVGGMLYYLFDERVRM